MAKNIYIYIYGDYTEREKLAPRFERFLQIGYRRFVFIEDTEASIDRIVSALHQKKKKKKGYIGIFAILAVLLVLHAHEIVF